MCMYKHKYFLHVCLTHLFHDPGARDIIASLREQLKSSLEKVRTQADQLTVTTTDFEAGMNETCHMYSSHGVHVHHSYVI